MSLAGLAGQRWFGAGSQLHARTGRHGLDGVRLRLYMLPAARVGIMPSMVYRDAVCAGFQGWLTQLWG